jgi:hypothetical protein
MRQWSCRDSPAVKRQSRARRSAGVFAMGLQSPAAALSALPQRARSRARQMPHRRFERVLLHIACRQSLQIEAARRISRVEQTGIAKSFVKEHDPFVTVTAMGKAAMGQKTDWGLVGLGLTLVAAVAKLHGGSLELADNRPGLRGLEPVSLLDAFRPSAFSRCGTGSCRRLVRARRPGGRTALWSPAETRPGEPC